MKRSLSIVLFIVFSLTLIFTGCSAPKEVTPLRIGVMSDMGAVPFIIAAENGLYEKQGIQVEFTVFKSALDRDTAFQTGNLDGIMADMLTAVFFADSKLNAKIVAETYGNYRTVTTPSLDENQFLALPTQTIGISSNTVIEFATDVIAPAKGYAATLEKVAIPQMPVRLEMLSTGQLSAATLPEPLASAMVVGGGTIVSDTASQNLYPGIFIVTESALKDKRESFIKFFGAYNEAVAQLNTKKVENIMPILIEKLSFPPTLEGNLEMPTFDPIKAADPYTFDAVMAFMQEKGLTQSEYTLSDLFTDELIQ